MTNNTHNLEKLNKVMIIGYGVISYRCNLNPYINRCPKCQHTILPKELHSYMFKDEKNEVFKLSLTYLCPNCFDSYICQYRLPFGLKNGQLNEAYLNYIAPKTTTKEFFSDIINEISPGFIDFYNQSLGAEMMGLRDIAGPGYRKSLEFLIKDFAIKNHPNKKETIEKTPLAKCIDTFIENQTIKDAAKAATWLGNDQTHYKQKHTDKNLEDLKLFIKITINWIELNENTKIVKQFISQ
ncbi:hypothetical protein CN335_21410 [Bacillus thuringiensis]|uniref:DUF4145 domain-containing protein n=1 Tax=Bacillus thuringiensis TaxID=1428 RepID=UPI000BF50E22|nr:DUF4145 domain-containing protein [Bacillus thuringiensis]PFF33223.1 hypothetical protein CN335_21410 [Bacillus thuringiensis]PFT16897.1 hypothetical protein COK83_10225 [Bacillus thuringiensis]